VVLPAPFGPMMMVGAPAASATSIRSMMVTSRTTNETSSKRIGRLASGARMIIPPSVRRSGAYPTPPR
jgi:hypothetical protein